MMNASTTIRYCVFVVMLSVGCAAQGQWERLQSGDLLFVRDTGGMGLAVQQTTGQYTHVVLVERCGDSLFIIDATPTLGVSRRALLHSSSHSLSLPFTPSHSHSYYDIYRLTIPFDTAAVIARAHSFLGQQYDDAFMHDNGALYCSELIYECFLDSAGNHLFEAVPMNWRAPDGTVPQYWLDHFRRLNAPIPEGLPGTNPTDLSHSPLLKKQ